jgi:hypothetical protein
MKRRANYLVGSLLCAALAAVAAVALVRAWKWRENSELNPYAYSLEEFKKVPPQLLRYREALSFPVGIQAPRALAVDGHDRIYAAGTNELAVFTPAGEPVATFPLDNPARCLAVGQSGDILVGTTHHVDVYSPTGGLKVSWVSLGELALLTSVAIHRELVFVADAGTRVVWRLDSSGQLLGAIGADEAGGANKHFVVPSPYFDVAVGREGDLWIVNPGDTRIERYTETGVFVSAWGRHSMGIEGFCGCCNPVHLALRSDGAIVTSEKGLPRIKVCDASGNLLAVVAAPDALEGSAGSADLELNSAAEAPGLDLAVDSTGRVLALDAIKGAIRVFVEKEPVAGSSDR